MARLIEGRKRVEDFMEELESLEQFLQSGKKALRSDKYQTWIHEYVIIRAYREFEKMVFGLLVAAINRDNTVISKDILKKQGIDLALKSHISKDQCEFLITGRRYFEMGGADGLARTLRSIVGKQHYLYKMLVTKYGKEVRMLHSLRNFAAHESPVSKYELRQATGMKGIKSSGSWLKHMPQSDEEERNLDSAGDWLDNDNCPQTTPRIECFIKCLKKMAKELRTKTPA